jgi:ribosomal protein S18 acetylase RimI-like enzyme
VSSYRFCRTDDMPLLVEAYNRAFRPHFAGLPELDREGLKRWIRDIDLWCSSCMIARDDAGDLIGVLLGCKRPTETLVFAVGVHPEHARQGHGRHLLTSLSSKLSILGPPRLVAEVPADDARACAFFESCGWTVEARMRDFTLDLDAIPARLAPELVAPITVDELVASGALAVDAPRPWSRSVAALAKRKDVEALAITSPDRIEAWLLWRDNDGIREIQAMGSAPDVGPLMPTLLGHFASLSTTPIVFARVVETERLSPELEATGFRGGPQYVRHVGMARPG